MAGRLVIYLAIRKTTKNDKIKDNSQAKRPQMLAWYLGYSENGSNSTKLKILFFQFAVAEDLIDWEGTGEAWSPSVGSLNVVQTN